MTNTEIAKKIAEIGQVLEILDENSFKIVAYERAARIIEMHLRPLEDIYAAEGIKGLQQINGIGVSISEKIEELIKTGKISYLEKIFKKVPKPILEFTQIPDVGPKTAKKLYIIFKAKNIAKLKQDLESGKFPDKIKSKTRANILRGINILSHQSGRMLLSFAEPIARQIIARLKTYQEIEVADSVGSLRRMAETIGDIDIVVSQRKIKNQNSNIKNNGIIDKFVKEDFVDKIIDQGKTKATIIHKKGPQVDLEILPTDEYGSLLQHFTGSKDHNIALRTYAEKQGFSISEHGIKKMQNVKFKFQNDKSKSKIIKCNNEKQVYDTLNMQTPPPEIRENQGEIESALKHQIPHLVELKDIKGDLQMHTTYSDGQNTIEEMAISCKKIGYQYLAITDHPSTLGITQGLREKDIDAYLLDIKKAEKKVGIKIFSGIEANIRPNGDIDLLNMMLKKFEFVIASVHSSFRQNKTDATARMIKAISNPFVKLIAHPTGRLINRRPGIELDWAEIFKAAKKYNKILEINAFPDRLDLNDTLVREAIGKGVKLMINTDSHNPTQFDNMRYGVATARRGWATKNDIVNTYTLNDFKKAIGL